MMFLKLGTEIVRSALVTNYKAPEASNYMSLNDFKINKLAPFINSANILDINNLLNMFEILCIKYKLNLQTEK